MNKLTKRLEYNGKLQTPKSYLQSYPQLKWTCLGLMWPTKREAK